MLENILKKNEKKHLKINKNKIGLPWEITSIWCMLLLLVVDSKKEDLGETPHALDPVDIVAIDLVDMVDTDLWM